MLWKQTAWGSDPGFTPSGSMTQAGAFTSEHQLPHLHDVHDNTGNLWVPPVARMIITAWVREPKAGPREGCKGTAESPSETQVIPWAHLAEDKEGADIPETGLLLEEVFM